MNLINSEFSPKKNYKMYKIYLAIIYNELIIYNAIMRCKILFFKKKSPFYHISCKKFYRDKIFNHLA